MKRVCAWCGRDLGNNTDKDDAADTRVTHGICQSCLSYYQNPDPDSLQKFLDKLEVPVMLVDEAGTVLFANRLALKYFGKNMPQVKNLMAGNVMECAYARLPGGCGNTIHCTACSIRNNVMDTYQTGRSLYDVPASLHRINRDSKDPINYLISTKKVGQIVVLKLDEVNILNVNST